MLVERTGAGYDGPRGGQQKSRGSDGNRGPWAAHLTPGWERDSLLPHTAGPPHGQKQAKKNEFIPESCSTCAGNVKLEVPRFRRSRSVRRTVRRRLQQRGACLSSSLCWRSQWPPARVGARTRAERTTEPTPPEMAAPASPARAAAAG